jgi:NADPH2:quinone reductase
MRAIVVESFGPPKQLRVGEVGAPVPGPDEVLVTVHAAPVNYADLLVVNGAYQFPPALPFIPGKGPAGVVAALGERVKTLRVGDRVLAMAEQGGYAEAVTVPDDQCYRLPPSMSFAEAASLSLVYDTAWFALRDRARLESGETVLVLGASGGVGQAAVQLAHAMGARVLGGIARLERAAAVMAAGADAVVDLSAANLRESLRAQVYAATDGRGVDIILDPLGGAIFEAAVRALAWRGRLVVIGFAAGAIATIRTNYLLLKNIEISGLQISDYRKRRPAQVAACFAEIFSLYEQGQMKPAAAVIFPLERAGEALIALRHRRIAGRAVLQLHDDFTNP